MRSLSLIRAVILAVGLLVCTSALAYERDKSDVVTLANGDHITGSIPSLEYGILSVKTGSVGTVAIEWHAVRSVTSRYAFAIERNAGFWTYDSRPPDPTAAGTDYGLTFNLGYTFGEWVARRARLFAGFAPTAIRW